MIINKYTDKNIQVNTNVVKNVSIEYFNDSLKSFNINDSQNFVLKTKLNDKFVSMFTNNLENYNDNINILHEISSAIDNDDESSFASESISGDRKSYKQIDHQEIINFFNKVNDLRVKFDKIFSIQMSFNEVTTIFEINNKDVNSYDGNKYFCFSFVLTYKNENKSEFDFVNYINVDIDFNYIYNLIIYKINNLYKKYNTIKLVSDKYTVLLNSESTFAILNSFKLMFMAKSIKQNTSPLSNKFNSVIFSDKINIIEDPINKNYPGSRLMDSEGSKTSKKTIIKDGKFITKLYDNQTAKKDNINSTGNSYGVRNLYIEPSNVKIDDVTKDLDNYVFIDKISGLSSGTDFITGSISVQGSGFLIKDGEKIALDPFIINSSIFEIFSNILNIGDDLTFYNTSVGAPSILVKGISLTA